MVKSKVLYVMSFFVVSALVLVLVGTTSAAAYTQGDTATFTGTLEASSDSSYTHELAELDVYLILSSSYDALEGKEVKVSVEYTDEISFVVTGVVATDGTTPNVGSPAPEVTNPTTPTSTYTPPVSGDVVTTEGVLEVSSDATYTHKVGAYNLIISNMYADWVGDEVTLTVRYIDDSMNFTVESIALK